MTTRPKMISLDDELIRKLIKHKINVSNECNMHLWTIVQKIEESSPEALRLKLIDANKRINEEIKEINRIREKLGASKLNIGIKEQCLTQTTQKEEEKNTK